MKRLVSMLATIAVSTALISVTALASPSAAATGFHAAYFSESDFLSKSPGQTGQFAVGYSNTGDQAWIKGAANQQANLATAAPLDNTSLSSQGWNSGWLSANRYAAQSASLVAPGQVGFFIYNIQVPASQPAGVVNFYGRPVIDGVAFLEDYGYYQAVNVTGGQVLITSTTPASPNTNPRPTVSGVGAGASCTVTLLDGTTNDGTGTSDVSGNFSIISNTLGAGSHGLSATATCPDGSSRGSGNVFTYVVGSGSGGGGAFVSSASALDSRNLTVIFTQCVQPNSAGATSATAGANDATQPLNYDLDGAGAGFGITQITMNSNSQVTIFLAAPLVSPSGHNLVVSNVMSCAGATMASPETAPFTFSDTTGPTLSSAAASAAAASTTTRVDVTWNEPVQCAGTYTVDGITAAVAGHPSASATGQTQCQLTTQALTAGTSHTLSVLNERDQGTGNAQSTNPASTTFTVATNGAFAISGSSGIAENIIRVTWNMNVTTLGAYSCQSPNLTAIACTRAAASNGVPSQVDVTLTAPFSVSGCATFTSCAVKVTVTGATATGSGGTTIPESPDPQSTTATIVKDTTSPSLLSAAQIGTTQDTFDATWNENVTGPQACVTTTCPFRIKSGATILASTIIGEGTVTNLSAGDNVAGDAKTRLIATAPLNGGGYTLDVTAGAVKDLSAAANPSLAGTVSLTVADTTRPTATFSQIDPCTAGNPCKQFQFNFSEPMATSGAGSVLDISHYKINGAAITGLLSVNPAGTIVTLTLASDAPAGSDSLLVTGDTDVAGNVTNPNPLVENFTRVP